VRMVGVRTERLAEAAPQPVVVRRFWTTLAVLAT
jgi:hypothetical protein